MPKKNKDGFDFFKDRQVANEISKRYEPTETRHGIDRVDQVDYRFHTGIRLTPIDRW